MSSPNAQTTPAHNEAVSNSVSAFERVWTNGDLRQMIFSHLDYRALTVMLRVERKVTRTASDVIYRHVGAALSNRMKRAKGNPRQAAYCDSVESVDTSPLPFLNGENRFFESTGKKGPVRAPRPFHPPSLEPIIRKLFVKHPNLRTIHNRYSVVRGDDTYTLQLDTSGKIVSATVETPYIIDVDSYPFTLPTFPPSPTHTGIQLTHTFALILTMGDDGHSTWRESQDRRILHIEQWRRWIYCGQELDCSEVPMELQTSASAKWVSSTSPLDPRVSSIDHRRAKVHEWITTPVEQAIAFLESRSATSCAPPTAFQLDRQSLHSLDFFPSFIGALGSAMRVLELDQTSFGGLECAHIAVSKLSAALPNLEELTLGLRRPHGVKLRDMPRLVGFPKLRRLCIKGMSGDFKSGLPRFICGLGSFDCIYQDAEIQKEKDAKIFQKNVLAEKRSFARLTI